ncbi:MAG TPA: SDR family oxidoreductase [Hypericibacter adhaerens]|uniref:SDR family NAD(P)-dependent oxidoreductase n=1 Tax=Hypericibacter adhaerens TaxID=2602016 RepID=UPI001CD9E574|nr:SDR family oxidoreductase [Hypericibacter adhaerens]HWA45870.1 SDR family oxidoreductase [Hypericibacter adhaerens]
MAAHQDTVFSRFRLDGRTALVTGAGGGIGEGIAFAMAEAGAKLVLVGRNPDPLETLAKRIETAGLGQAQVRLCDVRNNEAVRGMIGALPALDILVNNAGTNIPGPFLEVSEENFDAIMTLNTRASFFVAQAAVKKMLEDPARAAKGGAIINVSSQMGHVGSPNRTVYCMSKHGLEGLTKAMALELVPHRIRVNSLAPTFVETPLVQRIVDTPEKRNFLVSRIPMGEMAQVEDVVGAAVFLASPAAAMITGTCLLVDGGWTAQ